MRPPCLRPFISFCPAAPRLSRAVTIFSVLLSLSGSGIILFYALASRISLSLFSSNPFPRMAHDSKYTASDVGVSSTVNVALVPTGTNSASSPSLNDEELGAGVVSTNFNDGFDVAPSHDEVSDSLGLGFALYTYVLSLPHRADRRADMERLRVELGAHWTYVDAVNADDLSVKRILEQVRMLRDGTEKHGTYVEPGFENSLFWPEDIDSLATSSRPLAPGGADLWTVHDIAQDTHTTTRPLTCATQNNTIPPYVPGLLDYQLLTPAKVACWQSHLQVIRRAANGVDGVTLVLEDDVDMEQDIRERMHNVLGLLPVQWDLLYLGHCWSNESYYPAIGSLAPPTRLYPSRAPKCTHAYALTRAGARRVLLHLRYVPFAYSRAIDQALAWLVLTGRLRSFSVVPSVVAQRKVSTSDIVQSERGSGWRDTLTEGVLGTA